MSLPGDKARKRDHASEHRPILRAAEALDFVIERHFELDPGAGFDKDVKLLREGLLTVTQDLSMEDRLEVMAHAMALRLTRYRMLMSGRSALESRFPEIFESDDEGDSPESDSGGGVGGMGGPSVGKGKPKADQSPPRSAFRRTIDRLKGKG